MKLSTEIKIKQPAGFYVSVFAADARHLGTLIVDTRREANAISKLLRAVPPKKARKT